MTNDHTNSPLKRDVESGKAAADPAMNPVQPKRLDALKRKYVLYKRLVRAESPAGLQLLLFPCYWGVGLAVTHAMVVEGADPASLFAPFIPLHLIVLFFLGAFMMRGAACVVDDMWDRKYDRLVERTAQRPLACGAMSMAEAWVIVFFHLLVSGVVALNLHPTALITCIAVTPIWVAYPLMKRFVDVPSVLLGPCVNSGILVGYAAVLGRVDLGICLPIYFGTAFWSVFQDTIYAYQDRRDDIKCGVKSVAILFGERTYLLKTLLPPIALGLVLTGFTASQSLPYYVGIALCLYLLYSIADVLDIHDARACGVGFGRNVYFALLLLLAICASNIVWTVALSSPVSHNVNTTSPLLNVLLLNQHAVRPAYSTEGFGWMTRVLRPAFVYAESVRAAGLTEAAATPVWIPHGYFHENVHTILYYIATLL